MKKRKYLYVALFVFIYLAMLVGLTIVEGSTEGAAIQTLPEAFWYSITTLTTVGYGDFYPITTVGRVLGFSFMILSAGFFGFTVSLFVSKLSGSIVPTVILKLSKKQNWYIFSTIDENSLCLADSIADSDSDGVVVFCGKKEKDVLEHKVARKAVFAEISLEEIIALKKGIGRITLLSMGENGLVDCQNVIKGNYKNVEVYCETDIYINSIPAHLHLFNRHICMARFLWANYPLLKEEKKIVFIGCEKYGNDIIEQALLVNVDGEIGNREFHIFENSASFFARHRELSVCFGINEKVEGKDSIYFYEDNPFSHMELLENADRIVVCGDSDADNAAFLGNLAKYVPITGKVYIRQKSDIRLHDKEMVFFGANEDVLSYDIVIRDSLTQKAKQMHADYCKKNPEFATGWDALTNFTRRSNMSVADHIQTKIRILLEDGNPIITEERLAKAREKYLETKDEKADLYRRIEHERWMRFHVINNWSYAESRSNKNRNHTMILPFDDLTKADQAKDDYSWEIL